MNRPPRTLSFLIAALGGPWATSDDNRSLRLGVSRGRVCSWSQALGGELRVSQRSIEYPPMVPHSVQLPSYTRMRSCPSIRVRANQTRLARWLRRQ